MQSPAVMLFSAFNIGGWGSAGRRYFDPRLGEGRRGYRRGNKEMHPQNM